MPIDTLQSCKAADRAKAEEAIGILYGYRNFPPPAEVKWFLSPRAAADWIRSEGNYVIRSLDFKWNGISQQPVYDAVSVVWQAVNGNIGDRVELETIDFYHSRGDRSFTSLERAAYGKLLEEVTVWWGLNGLAIVIDRPSRISARPDGLLHNPTGPAVEWRDGNKDYAIDGVPLPAFVIEEPSKITVQDIKDLGNKIEARRIWINCMGLRRFLAESKAETIDVDGGLPGMGGAPRALVRDCFGDQWLVGTDGSTTRVYFMSVPPDSTTCKDAHERISGLESESMIAMEC